MVSKKHSRRQYSSEEKAKIVKRHLVGNEDVSDICVSLDIAPNMFYRWQKELIDNAAAAFEVKKRGPKTDVRVRKLEQKVEKLSDKLKHKDSVIAEITEDYVMLKKTLGED